MTYAGLTKFARFQVASLSATAVDFCITILLKEIFGFHYLPSTSIGTFSGGLTNFMMCRNWVFRANEHGAFRQAFRYVITWTSSILLNISIVYLLTSIVGINYILSKIVTSIIIGVTFNYHLQRRFVFVRNHNSINGNKINRNL
ncbi:MAG TPA: GtrA family protein [Lentimicrobium sp.]|nr:GtrA family protein [Lentimicrobium sp.]